MVVSAAGDIPYSVVAVFEHSRSLNVVFELGPVILARVVVLVLAAVCVQVLGRSVEISNVTSRLVLQLL
jgi:hypothetical protein